MKARSSVFSPSQPRFAACASDIGITKRKPIVAFALRLRKDVVYAATAGQYLVHSLAHQGFAFKVHFRCQTARTTVLPNIKRILIGAVRF